MRVLTLDGEILTVTHINGESIEAIDNPEHWLNMPGTLFRATDKHGREAIYEVEN